MSDREESSVFLRDRWTESDFELLSWHDNPIHALAILEGQQGAGELLLDIDFIVEWILHRDSKFYEFRLAPATLTFHDVSDLVMSLDYLTPTAGFCPPTIGEIGRETYVYPNGNKTLTWSIQINWPSGSIQFKSRGFTQALRATPIVVPRQQLEASERKPAFVG